LKFINFRKKQIKEALDTISFTPTHREQIKTAFLRCAKKITILKSKVSTAELLSMQKDEMGTQATSISVSCDSSQHLLPLGASSILFFETGGLLAPGPFS
jgi:hypothetical protein